MQMQLLCYRLVLVYEATKRLLSDPPCYSVLHVQAVEDLCLHKMAAGLYERLQKVMLSIPPTVLALEVYGM